MIFEQHRLPQTLEKHIDSILYFKDFTPNHSIERIVPTGHIFIIFELDNIPRNTFNNVTLKPIETFTKVWISGAHKNYLSISAHQNSEMLVIKFKPTGAFPFLHCSLSELCDKVIRANDILGEQILELRDNIISAESPNNKFEIVSEWLVKRFEPKKQAPESIISFIEHLQKGPISNFKKSIGNYPSTQKQLIEHFKKYVGLTPNYFNRILRFNEILKKISEEEVISWTEIAYSCDYSDQSHFIKEFTLFSGFNPVKFLKMDFPKERTNFFPLDSKG